MRTRPPAFLSALALVLVLAVISFSILMLMEFFKKRTEEG